MSVMEFPKEFLHYYTVLYSYQGEVVRVNPDNAEVRVVCVILGNLLQDLKELIAV